jgi:hypothetical protein
MYAANQLRLVVPGEHAARHARAAAAPERDRRRLRLELRLRVAAGLIRLGERLAAEQPLTPARPW